ncbi:MAG: MFS transporter [Anaerolineae bacterium]|nr:MFS transporter [Anaerolineae bacterium]
MKRITEERGQEIYRNLRHNFLVNVLDGGFFGFALGFASFTTILPLFVSQMTNSGLLIGLIPGLHVLGWQLPQLLTAKKLSSLKRFTPFVLFTTIHERLPYLGLALTAWFLPVIGNRAGLILTFLLLTWQGIGGGFAANGWQNLIGKIIPTESRATFFGVQSALSNLLASVGAIAAGVILQNLPPRESFTLCFLIAVLLLTISWIFLKQNRETDHAVEMAGITQMPLWSSIVVVLRRDRNFLWFLIARMLSQFGLMAFAFYTVYAVNEHGMSKLTAGLMTSTLLIIQVSSNLFMGRLADRWSKRALLEFGSIAALLSALLAALAPNLSWFVIVFILAGLANTAYWTVGLAMSIEFGKENERPTYIGMANTLVAPSALLAPLFGGWLADLYGYITTFLVAAAVSVVTALIYHFFVSDPHAKRA